MQTSVKGTVGMTNNNYCGHNTMTTQSTLLLQSMDGYMHTICFTKQSKLKYGIFKPLYIITIPQ